MQRFDPADLRRRAHSAKEKLRELSEHLTAPAAQQQPPPKPGFRFKRRWVLVPTLIAVILPVALIAGIVVLVADLGQYVD